ncbi:MAG: mycofactocin biosynthesis glycosyltransferase MftF [Steroidobacteraceae bacterium]|nr:mycofactocin biosynthesis glycosyltransferase MftF [Deltaproteobacteria bacterium]
MNYRMAQHVELLERDGNCFLVSKTPLRALRLNRSLADLVGRGPDGSPISASESETGVMEQLVKKGFMERLQNSSQLPATLPEITVVVPVKDRADELRRCLASLARLSYPQDKLQVIVVDDGSLDDSPLVAREFGALLVPSGGCGRGPAAARNVGAARATGEILAFIDSDCSASIAWLDQLIPSFNDPAMAAVGGQVDGMCTESAVDRYEAVMSSLSIGNRERIGNSGHDTFYLPSCNLLVRRSAFNSAGGFKDEMHVGEDVDLTWRLRDQGWSIAYLPVGNVLHEHRSSIRSFMSRRFDYGTSEGLLQLLHPQRRKQMVIPPLLALVLALALTAPFAGWWPLLLAAIVLAADAVATKVRLSRRQLPISFTSIIGGRLRALGSLLYYLCYHLVRYYATPLLLIALFVPGSWSWLLPLAALLCAAGVDYVIKKPKLTFVCYTIVYLLEQLAYGAGVFWGCLSRKCFASYRVVIFRQMEQAA